MPKTQHREKEENLGLNPLKPMEVLLSMLMTALLLCLKYFVYTVPSHSVTLYVSVTALGWVCLPSASRLGLEGGHHKGILKT